MHKKVCPLGPSKKNHCKRKHNSQEDETKLLVPNAQYHKFRLAIIQIEKCSMQNEWTIQINKMVNIPQNVEPNENYIKN